MPLLFLYLDVQTHVVYLSWTQFEVTVFDTGLVRHLGRWQPAMKVFPPNFYLSNAFKKVVYFWQLLDGRGFYGPVPIVHPF